jgi:hypothetical protein
LIPIAETSVQPALLVVSRQQHDLDQGLGDELDDRQLEHEFVGHGRSADLMLALSGAIDKAKQDGRVEIARQLDLRVEGLSKRFVEETGLNEDAELLGMFSQVSKTVVSDSLSGTRMSKQKLDREGATYRAYVQMEMPIGEANARFLEKIRTQERLNTRLRSTEAFEELDREVQAYEEWKRKQLGDDK